MYYNIKDNYYLSDCQLVYETKNVSKRNNNALSPQEFKSSETIQDLNNSNDSLYCKWVAGENGYPIPDYYSELLADIQDIIIDSPDLDIDYDKPLNIFNLNGIKISEAVDNLAPGIYIIRQGSIIRKIVIK